MGLVLELLLLLDLELMARDVLTKLRWLRRLNMTMLCSVTIPTTRGVTPLTSNYESQQEEECEENFRKSCFIEYEKIAFNETVQICRTPLVKDCDVQGPEICRTEYESECWTKQEVHDVEDDVVECTTEVEEKCEDETSGYTTNTKCSKWPR